MHQPRYTIELGPITQHNVKMLETINTTVFPVLYNDKFYKDVVNAGELAQLAYFNDIIVGGVACRVDNKDGQRRMYIMTLACLAPYRRWGVGTLMLQHVFDLCARDSTIEGIYLHVQVSNEDALAFYKHHGFEIVETVKNYYLRIDPPDAYLLERKVQGGEKLSKTSKAEQ